MKKAWPIVLSLILLAAIAYGAFQWAFGLMGSFYAYRSPLRGSLPPGDQTDPLARQVVLVVVDGLRDDVSQDMPFLNQLRRQGAWAQAIGHPPSFSQPTWTTLVSGAGPEISDAPLLNVENRADIRPITVDTLFSEAHRAGLTAGLAGYDWWERMVPAEVRYAEFFVAGEDAAADREVLDAARRFLANFRLNFLLVHFDQVDLAGHEHGGASPEYAQAARRVDDALRDIAGAMDLRRSVLIVTADHGHLDRGGHGGGEPVVLTTPLVMVGPVVEPGRYEPVDQTDVAPTVAAILGLAFPGAAQGRVRYEMLRLDEAQRAEKEVALAQQRVALGARYLSSIGRGPLTEESGGDVVVARSSLAVKNYASAYRLADIAVAQIDEEMAEARAGRIADEQRRRQPLAIAVVAIPILIWLWRRSRRTLALTVAAFVSVSTCIALLVRQGGPYSLSGVTGLTPFLLGIAGRVGLSLAVGAVLVLLWLLIEGERSAWRVAGAVYAFSFIVIYLWGLVAATGYVLVGRGLTWYVPDLLVVFLYLLALLQIMLTAALSLLLPLPVVVLHGLINGGAGILTKVRKREVATP